MYAPDQSRRFYADALTFEGTYLDPVKQTVTGTSYVYGVIGFSLGDNIYASGNGTHQYAGKRIDESVTLPWEQSYSNDIVTSVTSQDPCLGCGGGYVATLV